MNIPPTGNVEHLYSPSYGSRASSSISVNSTTCNLQRRPSLKSQDSGNQVVQSQYSSMPLVYYTSQDRLNKPAHSQHTHNLGNHSWSSFDRLSSPLLSHEVAVLASKGKVTAGCLQVSTYPHPNYTSHLYTPTRARKPAQAIVGRSASFGHSELSFSRTASDGMYRVVPSNSGDNARPSFNTVTFEDMPSLPPPYASAPDDSIDSPIKHVPTTADSVSPPTVPPPVEKIDSILQSVERHTSVDIVLPPLPSTEPPMFTPHKVEKEVSHSSVLSSLPHPPDSPLVSSSPLPPDTPTTFDYSGLGSLPQSPLEVSKVEDDDFDFASPPPIPVSSPPQDETDTHTPAAEIEPLHNAQVKEASKESQKIDRTITPRRALAEAFKELDKIGESPLVDANISQEDSAIDALYAKVDMSKKSKKTVPSGTGLELSKDYKPEEDTISQGESRDNEAPDLDALYAKVDMSKKTRRSQTTEESINNGPQFVLSVEDVSVEIAKTDSTIVPPYAVVNITGGAPTSLAPSKSSLEDPGYARIEDIQPASGDRQMSSLAPTSKAPTNPSMSSLADPGYARIEDIRPASGDKQMSSLAPTSQGPSNPSMSSLADPGYARIEDIRPAIGRQTDSSDTQPTDGGCSEAHTKVTLEIKGDPVRKASSEANVAEVDIAVVDHPKRASMSPEDMPRNELDYEPVLPLPSKR